MKTQFRALAKCWHLRGDLSSIIRPHRIERENRLPQVTLWPPHKGTHTHTVEWIQFFKKMWRPPRSFSPSPPHPFCPHWGLSHSLAHMAGTLPLSCIPSSESSFKVILLSSTRARFWVQSPLMQRQKCYFCFYWIYLGHTELSQGLSVCWDRA